MTFSVSPENNRQTLSDTSGYGARCVDCGVWAGIKRTETIGLRGYENDRPRRRRTKYQTGVPRISTGVVPRGARPGMAPPPRQPLLPPGALRPRHSSVFDPWNSVSTGHQRADGAGAGTMWREWRNTKLSAQYAGKEGKKGDMGPVEGGEGGKMVSVADMLVRPGAMRGAMAGDGGRREKEEEGTGMKTTEDAERERAKSQPRGIFDGLVIYVNGSTHPLVSDHKLKQLLTENGARMSLHLGRRRVTHVILGRPGTVGRGAGGGLAGSKLEKEVRRVGGCGVKYVGAEW